MDIVVYSPVWFFGYDSISELISMFITFFIGFYSYKIYKLTQQKKFRSLSISFMLIGIAFLAKSLTNWIIYREWVPQQLYVGKIIQLYNLYNFGYIVHVLLMLSAYALFVLLLWDIKDKRIITILFAFALLTTFFCEHIFITFHLVSLLLLVYIVWEFWKNARKTKHGTAWAVFSAFLIIAISQIVFLFIDEMQLFYVAGEIVQLLGYLVLLGTLVYMIFKK